MKLPYENENLPAINDTPCWFTLGSYFMMVSQSHFFPINLKAFRVTLMDDHNHSIYIAMMTFSLIALPVTISDVNVEAKGH